MQNQYVVLKSPVKIGDYDRVDSYSKSLVKGEEQLLVTRDCKFFLTDGNGGYLEFKTINSGITLDEVTQMVNNLNTSLTQNITDRNTDLSKSISDLDTKIENQLNLANNDIATLKETVTNLGLEFNSYVTQEEFDNLSATVTSTTELATHDNRDTLDKFSEDSDGNPLYNSKKIVADFDTSGIEAEIADLNNRSIIGSSLDFGFYKMNADQSIELNTPIPFSKTSGNLDVTDGTIVLKAGKKYSISTQIRTVNSSAKYGIYADGILSSSLGFCYVASSTTAPTAATIIECTKDTNITICLIEGAGGVSSSYSYLSIQEIGRTTIIDPAEDAKKIQFEYGVFAPSDSYSTGSIGPVNFNTMLNGNMALNTVTKSVKLKGGKTYSINYSIVGEYVNLGFALRNISTGAIIGTSQGAKGYNLSGDGHEIYTVPTDCEIDLEIIVVNSGGIIRSESRLIIEEMAQPYYFNYYKDSISSTVLFNGNANAVESYNLLDDIANYKYLLVEASEDFGNGAEQSQVLFVDVSTINKSPKQYAYDVTIDTETRRILYGFPDSTTLEISLINKSPSVNLKNTSISKITGIGYNYENPYRDIVSSVEGFDITDAEADSAITDIWNEVGV